MFTETQDHLTQEFDKVRKLFLDPRDQITGPLGNRGLKLVSTYLLPVSNYMMPWIDPVPTILQILCTKLMELSFRQNSLWKQTYDYDLRPQRSLE